MHTNRSRRRVAVYLEAACTLVLAAACSCGDGEDEIDTVDLGDGFSGGAGGGASGNGTGGQAGNYTGGSAGAGAGGSGGSNAGGTAGIDAGAAGAGATSDGGLDSGSGGDSSAADGSVDVASDGATDACVRSPGELGGPCTTSRDCDSAPGANDGFCPDGDGEYPAQGFCMVTGCTDDLDCPAGGACVEIETLKVCFPACGSGTCTCAVGELCGSVANSHVLDKDVCVPGNVSAVDGDPCEDFGDCDEGGICDGDPFEHPNGECMQPNCTVGDDSTCTSGGDGHCIDVAFTFTSTVCVDACTVDEDCRTEEGYVCFDSGGSAGKYCRHSQVGDPCSTVSDCGDAGTWVCRTGADYPGGYCTLLAQCSPASADDCPQYSSACYTPPGGETPYCVDRCTGTAGTQGSCRAGYVCTTVPAGKACLAQ